MIVLDASVLIAHLVSRDPHHERARRLMTELAGEDKSVNVLTRAEALVLPARAGQARERDAELASLGLLTHELSADSAVLLAEVRAATGLRMPDCCVLLSAEQLDAGLGTFDDRLAQAATRRGISVVAGHPESG